ncbi:hypothetical protein ABIB51_001036 [Arthrobacter sp. UYCu712]
MDPTLNTGTTVSARRSGPSSEELSWTSLDQRAVDTIRVLAADAVE